MERGHAPQPTHGTHGGSTGPLATTASAMPGEHLSTGPAHPKARFYVFVFIFLFVVTAAEVAVTYVPSIPQVPVLIVLAVVKFGTIAGVYMHLRFDSRVFSAFFLTGLIIAIGMLFSLMGLFAAHYRLPFEQSAATEQSTTGASATPGAISATGTGR